MKQFLLLLLTFWLSANGAFAQNEREKEGSLDADSAQIVPAAEVPNKSNALIIQLAARTILADFLVDANATCRVAEQIVVERTLSESQRIYLLAASQITDRQAFIQFIKEKPAVLSASWNAKVSLRDSIPNDELFDIQWNMERIGAPKVWEVTTGGQTANGHEIVVAVLDKGFDLVHPDLVANYWTNPGEIPNDGLDNDENGFVDDVRGWNFRQNSPLFSVEKHGTSVNGIIGAVGNNGIGIAGVNWNVKMMPLAIEYVDEVVAAYDYVLKMRDKYNQTGGQEGAFVVVTNGSFGIDQAGCDEYPAWGSMYDPMGLVGVLSVAATANGDWDIDEEGDIPTSCPSEFLIAVTNTGKDDNRAPGSAFGSINVDLGAPGQGTATTSLGNSYREDFSGTSSACPHVAGSIALLYSVPCILLDSFAIASPAECALLMRDAILLNTDAVASLADETVSGGRLNVYEAMKYLHAYCVSRVPERENGSFKELYVGRKGLIRVTPNPTTDRIFIDYGNVDFNGVKIRVFNMLGNEMILQQSAVPQPFEPQTLEIDVKDWSNGVYIINLFDLSKKISQSFLKL